MDAVLFDWDGTLADSHAAIFEATAAAMRAVGLDFDEDRYRTHLTPDWRLLYARLGVPHDRVEEAARVWERAFAEGPRPAAIAGALEAVRRVRAAGIATALVTSGRRDNVEPEIRRLGFDELLPVRVYGDDQAEQKPHPAPLLRALALIRASGVDVRPDRAAYLGDTPEDVRMALAAGVRSIGVVSVYTPAAALRDAGPDEVVGSVAAWVDRLLAGASVDRVSSAIRGS